MNIIIDYNQICLSPLTDSIVNILITLLFCYITKYFSSFSLQDGVAPGGNRPRPDHSRPGAELLGDFDLKKKVVDHLFYLSHGLPQAGLEAERRS
jgi:hypothetical protein